jgi:mono/diheme cytochrome c family protein
MLYPGSIMPAYDLEMNARKAIIAYLSSATAEDALLILSERPRPLTPQDAAIEAGKQSFARFGCVGCHGLELQGGVPNPNSQGGEVPSLLHASDD